MLSSKKCCVPGCLGSEVSHKKLHTFPKPEKDKKRFNLWALSIRGEIIGLKNDVIYSKRRVCHAHFEEKYCCRFDRLSNIAVPTLNLPVPIHKFPNYMSYSRLHWFNQWKKVLDITTQNKSNSQIYYNVRICSNHFEKHYLSTMSKLLTLNAVPTLNLGIQSTINPVKSQTDPGKSGIDRNKSIPQIDLDNTQIDLDSSQSRPDNTLIHLDLSQKYPNKSLIVLDLPQTYPNKSQNDLGISRSDGDSEKGEIKEEICHADSVSEDGYEVDEKPIAPITVGEFSWEKPSVDCDAEMVEVPQKISDLPVTLLLETGEPSLVTYLCNLCTEKIAGPRFVCCECENVDACARCESAHAHAQHLMLRVPLAATEAEVRFVVEKVRCCLLEFRGANQNDEWKVEVKDEPPDEIPQSPSTHTDINDPLTQPDKQTDKLTVTTNETNTRIPSPEQIDITHKTQEQELSIQIEHPHNPKIITNTYRIQLSSEINEEDIILLPNPEVVEKNLLGKTVKKERNSLNKSVDYKIKMKGLSEKTIQYIPVQKTQSDYKEIIKDPFEGLDKDPLQEVKQPSKEHLLINTNKRDATKNKSEPIMETLQRNGKESDFNDIIEKTKEAVVLLSRLPIDNELLNVLKKHPTANIQVEEQKLNVKSSDILKLIEDNINAKEPRYELFSKAKSTDLDTDDSIVSRRQHLEKSTMPITPSNTRKRKREDNTGTNSCHITQTSSTDLSKRKKELKPVVSQAIEWEYQDIEFLDDDFEYEITLPSEVSAVPSSDSDSEVPIVSETNIDSKTQSDNVKISRNSEIVSPTSDIVNRDLESERHWSLMKTVRVYQKKSRTNNSKELKYR